VSTTLVDRALDGLDGLLDDTHDRVRDVDGLGRGVGDLVDGVGNVVGHVLDGLGRRVDDAGRVEDRAVGSRSGGDEKERPAEGEERNPKPGYRGRPAGPGVRRGRSHPHHPALLR